MKQKRVMFNLSEYFTYLSSDSVSHRGGCAVLVKNSLRESIASIDCTKSCLISFKLKSYPDILFVSCYIPPKDSPYFTMDTIAELNSLIYSDDTSNKIVLIGDLNCRFGTLRQIFVKENSKTQYQLVSDATEAPNDNA